MALVSPGVEVSVIDESFYTPAEPGTVPLIFVATASNKANPSGTGTAPGTLAANAGRPYLLTSQRDLAETFGDPSFKTDSNNNPIHAGELNEYGLQAAYSLLGVSNRAYVVRADVDLDELEASATAPAGSPADGTYWFDTQNTKFGIFEWNGNPQTTTGGQSFTVKDVTVITDATKVDGFGTPKTSVGAIGDYVLLATTTLNKLFFKNTSGVWVEVGASDWAASWPTARGSVSNPTLSTGEAITINGTTVTLDGTALADLASDITAAGIAGVTASVVDGSIEIYSTGVNVVMSDNGDDLLTDAGLTAGTFYAPAVTISRHTQVPEYKLGDTNPRPTGSIWSKTTEPNAGARWRVKVYNADTQLFEDVESSLYSSGSAAIFALDPTGGGTNLPVGTLYTKYNDSEENPVFTNYKLYRRRAAGATSIRSGVISTGITAGAFSFDIQEGVLSSGNLATAITVSGTATGASSDADVIAGAINSAGFVNITATVDAQNRVTISHKLGGDFRLVDGGTVLTEMGYTAYVDANTGTTNLYAAPAGDSTNTLMASNWQVLSYTASESAPTALTVDGRLWYSSVVDEVDVMVHNGTTWVGYQDATSPFYSASEDEKTDPAGPIVSATEPTLQSDGSALKNGDLWIDTADVENYPTIYKYNDVLADWQLVDKTDQTTEDGILFADARYNTSGANSNEAGEIVDMLSSNFLDFDAPDPALYPKGMLLWNLRRSGFNVKRFARNYINTSTDNIRFGDESMSGYYANRWVTESANEADGSGAFGRKAQRKVVVQSLQATVNSNQEIRDDESRIFNLMATPGYPELIGEMISLNFDRGLTAFIVADSPARLTPDATSLNEWGTNVAQAVEDNDDGLVSRDEYMGVYYPWGFTSDNFGNNVVVPPSHMMLRTIALSDQVSYPWFAPAGTRRGGITNATSTGYVTSEGEFTAIALNEGQRDTLYSVDVNPITFITGAGLVAFGQKTRARSASSLDRINVVRLVVYLRSQLKRLSKPYLFEPNDKITRDEIKQAAESLCLELVGLRALYDYLVVCDESNNTPSRIDRNELYLDIAIEPVKAVEFIYIPLRLKNTGEISGL
jgi:hypothetical protein